MGFRVKAFGIDVDCETPEDVRRLAQFIRVADRSRTASEHLQVEVQAPRPGIKRTPVPALEGDDVLTGSLSTERVKALYSDVVGTNQDKLVLLLGQNDKATDRQLRNHLGLETNNALAGVTAGLTKNAKKAGIEFSILERGTSDTGEYLYSLNDDFRRLAKEVGWLN